MVQLPQDPAEEQVTDLIRVLTSGPHAVIRPPDPVVGEPKVGRNDPCHAAAARSTRSVVPPRDDAMTRYAILLRGVNVGTKNSLPMGELRAMLTKIGCTDVQTYVQSGNAAFETKLSEAALTKAIEHALEAYMGRPIATTLRTLDQMKAIVDGNPFAKVTTKSAYLCVTFLSYAPTKAEVAPLHAQDWRPELFQVAGQEIYTWHPNGQGRSPLAAALGKLPLRGAVTTRNPGCAHARHLRLGRARGGRHGQRRRSAGRVRHARSACSTSSACSAGSRRSSAAAWTWSCATP